jgi:urate oxidase
MPSLARNRYGKSRVRLVKVVRHPDRHDLQEVMVQILFEGDFDSCYVSGDNSRILPTDTMKNTVYALARQGPVDPIEVFGQNLAQHFFRGNPQITRLEIDIEETFWHRVHVDGSPQGSTFQKHGPHVRTATIAGDREGLTVSAGINEMIILKTSDSGFEGYIHDPFTTLRETSDRLFGTALTAKWLYSRSDLPFNDVWSKVMRGIQTSFATHKSLSVQHTLYDIGRAVLDGNPEVDEILLSMPNKHCLLVDLAPLGLDNPNEIFVPTDEPHGSIEARLVR